MEAFLLILQLVGTGTRHPCIHYPLLTSAAVLLLGVGDEVGVHKCPFSISCNIQKVDRHKLRIFRHKLQQCQGMSKDTHS